MVKHDYSKIVIVNEEFAEIQREEAYLKGAPAQENAQETAQEITSNKPIEDKIIRLLEKNPRMTRKDLSQTLNISTDAVKRKLEKLKKEGRISRQGSTKAGWWIVRESN